jgi:hypothetical protein
MGTTSTFAWPYPDPADPANVPADMQALAAAIDTTLGGAWSTYTPTWTGDTSDPAIGNGTIVGDYKYWGKTLNVLIRITIGTTTTFGTGAYRFSLPPTYTQITGHSSLCGGWGVVFDTSAMFYYAGTLGAVTGNDNLLRLRTHALANMTATSPVTLATGDAIALRYSAEIT